MDIKNLIKTFCKNNYSQEKIDFSLFQNPECLHNKYGGNQSFNKFKGDIFELLLTELFRGNGYLADRIGEGGNDGGCDVLVKHPIDNSIMFVIQAKNWNEAISGPDIGKEWFKFRENFKKQYELNDSHFCFVAWKYVKGTKNKLKAEFGINVWDEQDIIDNLFRNYSPQYPKYPSIQLKSYQESAFNNIIRFWESNKRCYVEHSTGTGKTYIIAKLVEILLLNINNKILILSPSTYINDRINTLLNTITPISNITLKFNSDKAVNILTYQYLYHNSVIISSNNFTHIIMDEAHRAGAPEWHEKGLLPIINTKTKIVGFSATMERYSSGVDVKKFLGNNCAGELSLFRAITVGILPSIGKYVYSVLDIRSKIEELQDEVKNKYKKFTKKKDGVLSLLDAKQIKDYSIQNVLHKYFHSIQYQKIIAFCEGYEHTNDIRKLLDNTFVRFCKPKIEKITSKQSKKENESILKAFSSEKPNKNQIHIIVAIDMLNEGIDVKGIDSIMLFRKTESPIVYLQQIGRVLRSHGKNNPLIFDCVLNYQNVKINLFEESRKEAYRYQKSLTDFGFSNIEIPKTISIIDEVQGISNIIEEVEGKLNFYRLYEDARDSVQQLHIKSESKYRVRYQEDPRLPSKPKNVYRNVGWSDWYDFLGTKRPNFYPTYIEAKNATKKLNIKSFIDYRKHYKEDPKLSSRPDGTYKSNGWIDWNDYFGTTDISNYSSYEKAKNAARKLNLKSYSDYRKRYIEDPKLPSKPERTYIKEWKNFNEFLGVKKNSLYPTLEEAKQAVLKLYIKSDSEYRKRRHEDPRLPATPSRYYKDKGWISILDFLSKPLSPKYLLYKEAKKAVKILSIKTRKEYSKRYKEDPKLPSNPEELYKDDWRDFYHFLGVKAPIYYKSYIEAKRAVEKLDIKSRKEYITGKRYKEDAHLPSNPSSFYKGNGWTKWDKFIITHYLTYEEAKDVAQKLKIRTRIDYIRNKQYKGDLLLPSNPEKTYKNKGWIDWYHFLGTNAPGIYKTYLEAQIAVQRLNIHSMTEYKIRRSENHCLPSSPSECYKKKGWVSSKKFLNLNKPEYYESYKDAQKAAQFLRIKNKYQYIGKKMYKKDPRLPSTPEKFYKSKGWKSWPSFLGVKPINIYPTYEKAKWAARRLNIKTGEEYRKQKLYKKDPQLPSTPEMKYRNKGWISFYDFLGFTAPHKYLTYEEAKQAAHKLKIKSRKEYHAQKRYLEDLGLTCKPERKFKNKGWISWKDFLG